MKLDLLLLTVLFVALTRSQNTDPPFVHATGVTFWNNGIWHINKETCKTEEVAATLGKAIWEMHNISSVHVANQRILQPYMGELKQSDDSKQLFQNIRAQDGWFNIPIPLPVMNGMWIFCDDAIRGWLDRKCGYGKLKDAEAYVEIWRNVFKDDYYVYLCPPYWKRPDNLSGYMKKVKDGKARTDVIDDAAYTTTSLWNSILYKSNPAAKKISLDDAANSPPDVYKLAQDKGVSKSIANAPSYALQGLGMWMLNNIPSLTKIPLPAGISTKRKRSRLTIIDDPIPDTEAPAPALAKAKRADNPTPTGPFETIITRTSSVSYAYENQATESWFTVESSYDSNADPTIAPEELSAFLMPTVPAGAGQTGAPVCQVGNYADQATCGSACDGGTCKEDPTASFDPWKCSCV